MVLSGYQAIKEAHVDQAEEFSGHGSYPTFFNFTKGNGKPAPHLLHPQPMEREDKVGDCAPNFGDTQSLNSLMTPDGVEPGSASLG